MNTLEAIIQQAWAEKDTLNSKTTGPFRDAVFECIDLLNSGKERVSEKKGDQGEWHVNEWLKKAVLLFFRLNDMAVMDGQFKAFDKVPLKCATWSDEDFQAAGFRLVPGGIVRTGAHIAKDVVVMPSFVNIGAYVGPKTMIDSGVTVGSCAQIGSNCHISSNALIGGVLEPLQATPTIIEDHCFIGAACSVTEGVHVKTGSVIGAGVHITASTPIINRETGDTFFGTIPPYSVVISGSRETTSSDGTKLSLNCAVIVKQVTEETRSKTSINDLLRA